MRKQRKKTNVEMSEIDFALDSVFDKESVFNRFNEDSENERNEERSEK